jgi:integrase
LGDKRIEEVTQMNIQDAATQLYKVEHYNARSIKEALSVLRECLDIAIVNKILSVNPCRGVIVHEGNEMAKERRVLNHWEQDAFLEEVNDSYYNEPYRILLVTGMRIGEFSGLQWDDVDFEKKVIHIRRSMMTAYQDGKKIMELTTPKTVNSYRSIPFFDDTENLFKAWKKKQDLYRQKLGNRWRSDEKFGDLVFTTTMGSPITRYNIVHDLKKVETNIILKENNRAYREGRKPREFGHLHPHCFRHTFATRCFEKGLDPVVVQSIMGHANYSTTLSYTHILEDKTKEEVAKVGKFL